MKKHAPLIMSFLFAVILGLGVGCAKKPDDAKISSEIQDKFSQDSGLSTKQLSVKAEAGVVTLSGAVDNDAQREAAGKQAAAIAGVKTVINNLEVSNVGKPSVVGETTPAAEAAPAATAPADNTPPPSISKLAKTPKSSKLRHDSGTSHKTSNDSAGPADTSDNTSQQSANNNMTPPAAITTAQQAPPPPPPQRGKYNVAQNDALC